MFEQKLPFASSSRCACRAVLAAVLTQSSAWLRWAWTRCSPVRTRAVAIPKISAVGQAREGNHRARRVSCTLELSASCQELSKTRKVVSPEMRSGSGDAILQNSASRPEALHPIVDAIRAERVPVGSRIDGNDGLTEPDLGSCREPNHREIGADLQSRLCRRHRACKASRHCSGVISAIAVLEHDVEGVEMRL
jgi:hypothetical protein